MIEWSSQLSFLEHKLTTHCKAAEFKRENACLEETRKELLTSVMDWAAKSGSQERVFWLHGKAGSGKTTVANTFARSIEERSLNLSCFFCKRDDRNLSNPLNVLPTLAYLFAEQHDSYRTAIIDFLHINPRGPSIANTDDIDTQFERFFNTPLAKTADPFRPHIIIIDALDECGTSKDQVNLVNSILSMSHATPWIKVFVTSRDEPDIREAFTHSDCFSSNINDEKYVDRDIELYIQSKVKELKLKLAEDDVRKLVDQADGLFIWCTTLFRYIEDNPIGMRKALDPFLSGKKSHKPLKGLYELYTKILHAASKQAEYLSLMRAVLGIINITAGNRPVSAKAISSFLRGYKQYGQDEDEDANVCLIIRNLHAVIYVSDESMNRVIRAYHSSFYDFLDKKAQDGGDWAKPEETHSHIFRRCLALLLEKLEFNVCKLEKPIFTKDIQDLNDRVACYIPEDVQYSTRFWSIHLIQSCLKETDISHSDISDLLCTKKVLFWLESLSLQGCLGQSAVAFEHCSGFFKVS